MTEAQVSQAFKIAIRGGNPKPQVTQAAKIIVLSVGSVPSYVSQGHKVVISRLNAPPTGGSTRGAIFKGATRISKVLKGTVPVLKVYAGSRLTHVDPSIP